MSILITKMKKLESLQKRNDCDLKTLAILKVDRMNLSPAHTVSLDEEIRKLTPEIMDQETRITELQTTIRRIRIDAEKYHSTSKHGS